MKKLFLAIALMWASVAQANIIEISTSAENQEVNPGEIVEYSIRLIGFEEFDFLTFDLFFGSSTGMENFILLDSDFPDGVPGLLVFESIFNTLSFSLLAPYAFDPSESTYSGSALLAKFSVEAGFSGIIESMLSNLEAGFDLMPLQNSIEVRVGRSVDVSEPATIGLFAALLIAGGMVRRRA